MIKPVPTGVGDKAGIWYPNKPVDDSKALFKYTFLNIARLQPLHRAKIWESVKRFIDSRPALYEAVIEDKMQRRPESVSILKLSKKTVYEYRFSYLSFDCFLQVKKFKDEDDKACYIAFNPHENVAYVRDLVNQSLQVEKKTSIN